MRKLISVILALAMVLSLGIGAWASGEASGGPSGGGGALPSGGNFGDVKTGVVKNAVVLAEGDSLTVNEAGADVYAVAPGGSVTAEGVTGLYIRNASVKNNVNASGEVEQGVSGVAFVDRDGVFGGPAGYYAVDEAGDPMTAPEVTVTSDGTGYSNVIILDDEDIVFSRQGSEIADGAALAIGGGTEENTLTVENSYLWTSGFKRTSLFADDQKVQLVVRDSRIVNPGADNYKKGWQALYGGARDTLLQNGDCWFYNDSIVTEGWGALAIDSSPHLDLYAVNTDVDVLGGGYVSYTPGDGSVNFYGVDADSAQYGVFVTGNSKAYMHSLADLDEAALSRVQASDWSHAPLTDGGRTEIHADYAAYLTHQGGGNSPTTEGYLYAENTLLSTDTLMRIHDNSHFLNDENGGTSWFWTEFWRGSTCLARSTNATFEFDNVELESRTGVVFRSVVNWEGSSKSFTLADDVQAVGNSLIMRNMDVTGDVRNDDVYRDLRLELDNTVLTGAVVSTTVDDWNAMFTPEALKASPAYAAALAEQASWTREIPNPTYDAEIPYGDFVLDLDTASANLTLPETDVIRGVHMTMDENSVWYAAGDSQLVSLTVAPGAQIVFPAGVDCAVYVNCAGLDPANGTAVDGLPAGTYENVVIVFGDTALATSGEPSGAPAGGASFEPGAGASAPGGSPAILLKGAAILDAAHNGEIADVLVRDGRIQAVGQGLSGDVVYDLTGYTLLPGLIDAHVHVAGSAGYGIENLTTWARHGITTVREEGMLSTSGEMEFAALIAEANHDPQSAYLVSCGKYFDVPGGYGMGPTGNMGVVVGSEEDIAAEIDRKAALGYPQVKVGVNSDTARMSPEQFIAAIDRAHENGMPVAAHVNYSRHLEELVGYGLDEASHTPSDEMGAALIASMTANGVRMNTSGAENAEEIKIANLKAFYEAGGIITVGTDLMRNYDGCMTALASQMATLYKAGLTVQQVIACATHNNALALGVEDAGDILPGYQADIAALPGALDGSFEALGGISFVMNDGVVIVD